MKTDSLVFIEQNRIVHSSGEDLSAPTQSRVRVQVAVVHLAHAFSPASDSTITCKLTAIIETDKDGVFAYCPELKCCHTQGGTIEEALVHLREAATLYLHTMKPAELRRLNAKTTLATSLEIAHA